MVASAPARPLHEPVVPQIQYYTGWLRLAVITVCSFVFEVKRLCLECQDMISLVCSLVFSLFNCNLTGELPNVGRDRPLFFPLEFKWMERPGEILLHILVLFLERMIARINQIQLLFFRGINKINLETNTVISITLFY